MPLAGADWRQALVGLRDQEGANSRKDRGATSSEHRMGKVDKKGDFITTQRANTEYIVVRACLSKPHINDTLIPCVCVCS